MESFLPIADEKPIAVLCESIEHRLKKWYFWNLNKPHRLATSLRHFTKQHNVPVTGSSIPFRTRTPSKGPRVNTVHLPQCSATTTVTKGWLLPAGNRKKRVRESNTTNETTNYAAKRMMVCTPKYLTMDTQASSSLSSSENKCSQQL